MKADYMDKLYELRNITLKPCIFAKWAMPSENCLNIPRARTLNDDGEVVWNIKEDGKDCADHIEMSGFYASAIISYGTDKSGRLCLMKHLVVPTLRLKPNLTSSSFSHNYSDIETLKINGAEAEEHPEKITVKGNLKIESAADAEINITREFLPAVNQPALIEIITVKNNSNRIKEIEVAADKYRRKTASHRCVGGSIFAEASLLFDGNFKQSEKREKAFTLYPGESAVYYCIYYAYQDSLPEAFSVQKEIDERRAFIDEMFSSIRLETPVPELNAQFSHCVLRGSESIFKTKNGLMHAPGGGNYYAALWTNDQCEYANPFFPFSGYKIGIEQSINCYSLYEAYMDKSDKPIKDKRALVTSIIAEGTDYWNGAGDRGDGEMYAYGISRFLLEMSDTKLIERFWDSLVWCLDFALSRKNEHGVISSDSDELENRLESGNANLFTSCITYDALGNSAALAEAVGDSVHQKQWLQERNQLRKAIENYFGTEIQGYNTYRYYDGNKDLRSWICMPLTVEIFDRADETVKALFSPELYKNGLMKSTSAGNTTWDRSLLFALRGVLLAGKAEKGMQETINYCRNRLLGSHCPYPFEAYPEGNMAHLAAESILFARIITEGLFGLKATGIRKLRIKPQLSSKCPEMALRGIRLFSECFDISADKNGISVSRDGHIYITDKTDTVFDFSTYCFE